MWILNNLQAEGFADDFGGCQGGGEGIYLGDNEQAPAADSRKSAAKPTLYNTARCFSTIKIGLYPLFACLSPAMPRSSSRLA